MAINRLTYTVESDTLYSLQREPFSRSTGNEGRSQQHDESSSYTSERRLFTRQRGDLPDWGLSVRKDLIPERHLYSRDRERPRSRSPSNNQAQYERDCEDQSDNYTQNRELPLLASESDRGRRNRKEEHFITNKDLDYTKPEDDYFTERDREFAKYMRAKYGTEDDHNVGNANDDDIRKFRNEYDNNLRYDKDYYRKKDKYIRTENEDYGRNEDKDHTKNEDEYYNRDSKSYKRSLSPDLNSEYSHKRELSRSTIDENEITKKIKCEPLDYDEADHSSEHGYKHQSVEKSHTSHDRKVEYIKRYQMIIQQRNQKRAQLNHNKRVKYPLPSNIKDDLDFENILATLKLLMVLEEYLGSLGPKIMELMTTAITMEKDIRNSSKSLLSNMPAVVLLEAAKEKLKGAVQAGIVPRNATPAACLAVMRTAATLHEADKHLQSRQQLHGDADNVSTNENNTKEDSLHEHEKENYPCKKEPSEELDRCSKSVSDKSRKLDDEGSGPIENPDDIQDLGLPELKVLLKNFKNLPYDEQQGLKLYLLNLKQGLLPDDARDLLESCDPDHIIDKPHEPVKIITAKNYKPLSKDGETSNLEKKMTTNLEEKTSCLELDRKANLKEKRIDYLECKSHTIDLKEKKKPNSEDKKSIKIEWIQTAVERYKQKKEEEKMTGIAERMQNEDACEESRNIDDEKTNKKEKASTFPSMPLPNKTTVVTIGFSKTDCYSTDISQDSQKNRSRWGQPKNENENDLKEPLKLKIKAPEIKEVPLTEKVTCSTEKGQTKNSKMITDTVMCPICEKKSIDYVDKIHPVSECPDFVKANGTGRWAYVRKNGLCYNCLRRRSYIHTCDLSVCGIDQCKLFHNKMLHSK